MSYKPRSLFNLIEQIQQGSLLLPHIQRPFVWEEEQMLRLFDSIMRRYPIQTLLFWRTKEEIHCRRFMPEVSDTVNLHTLYEPAKRPAGVEKTLVLDGQQRLQSLYTIFAGALANGSKREAWFDLTSGVAKETSDLLYDIVFAASNPGGQNLPIDQKPAAAYYRVRDLRERHARRSADDISKEVNKQLDALYPGEDESSRENRRDRVRSNISTLVSVLREEVHFWAEELDGIANDIGYSQVLDIFVRVNSGGTKLEPADLMFAAMKEKWDDVEQNIEEVANQLSGSHLDFDKHLVLKCLTLVHSGDATATPEKINAPAPEGATLLEKIRSNWPRAETAFEELRDFVANDLRIYHPKVVSSYLSFIPLFDYLYQHPSPTPENRRRMMAFYYSAHFFRWFSASGDSRLNKIHGIIAAAGADFPLATLRQEMAASYGVDTEFTKTHLASSRSRHALLNLLYVRRHGTSPFNVASKSNEPHIDHIYPRSKLAKLVNADGAPLLTGEDINHIGNYRYVGASDNGRKKAELPDSYFPRLAQHGVDLAPHLLVPEFAASPAKLTFDFQTYLRFRDARAQIILSEAQAVVNLSA